MGEGKRASGRTRVQLEDGRTIIVADGDVVPDGGKVLGGAGEIVEHTEGEVRTAEVKSPRRQTSKKSKAKK